MPDFSFETEAATAGFTRVAGVDEVGRGPLCGPVTAAAVILDPAHLPEGVDDSKKLSPARRARLEQAIKTHARAWAVVHVDVAEIDRLNIYHAAHLAMVRAVAALSPAADYVLVDGNRVPKDMAPPARAVVKGDARVASIAAASILAKEARDRVMVDLAQHYPGYGWDQNAGYPTKQHLAALRDLGITPHHRRSFRPVHNILYQEQSSTT